MTLLAVVDVTPTISGIEAAWTLAAGAGLLFRVTNLRDAWIDLSIAEAYRPESPAVQAIARASLRSEVIGAVVKLMYLVIGIWAMFIPNAPGSILSFGFVAGMVLVASIVLIDLNSYLWARERRAAVKRRAKNLESKGTD